LTFHYDNSDDYVEDEMYRIIDEQKMGYADENGMTITISCFKCTLQFKNDKVKSSIPAKHYIPMQNTAT